MDNYYLGIDGGGTKTEAVLCLEDGHILARTTVGPTNCNDRPAKEVEANLLALCHSLPHAPTTVYAGIAGAISTRDTLLPLLTACFPHAEILLRSDALNILNAGLLDEDGCGLICGTGSVCFVRREGTIRRIGGWGYLLDTKGSGFDIGRDGVYAALREIDGRGQKTLLTELIQEREKCTADRLLPRLYSGGKRLIASFAPLVLKAAEQNDPVASCIVHRNIAALAELVEAAAASFPDEFPVSVGGGILTHSTRCRLMLEAMSPARVRFTELYPPVFGAVWGAFRGSAQADEIPDGTAIRNAFMEDYPQS